MNFVTLFFRQSFGRRAKINLLTLLSCWSHFFWDQFNQTTLILNGLNNSAPTTRLSHFVLVIIPTNGFLQQKDLRSHDFFWKTFSNESDVFSTEKTKSRNHCQLSTTIWMYSEITYLFQKFFSKQNLKNKLLSTTWKFPNVNRKTIFLEVRLKKRHSRFFKKNRKLQCSIDWLMRRVKKNFDTCFLDKTWNWAVLIFWRFDQSSMSWCSSPRHFQKPQLK